MFGRKHSACSYKQMRDVKMPRQVRDLLTVHQDGDQWNSVPIMATPDVPD